jgi:hypothetical protein
MSEKLNFEARLNLLGITDDTKHNVRLFFPTFYEALDGIVDKFYKHLLSFPEAQQLLNAIDIEDRLAPRQKAHWVNLFSCKLDEQFVTNALLVGKVHFQTKVPPYLYLAGYNFFHCQIIKLATNKYDRLTGLPEILSGISRLITLDMDLALSAYTREYWQAPSLDPIGSAEKADASEHVFI